jgi:quercetin dioxygenase-like cupin family protein
VLTVVVVLLLAKDLVVQQVFDIIVPDLSSFQSHCYRRLPPQHFRRSSCRQSIFINTINMEGTNLPPVNRFITTHNAEGKATFSDAFPEELEWKGLPNGAGFGLGYTTEQYPVDFNNDKDLSSYKSYLQSPPGLVVPGGTVLRFVDCPPNSVSPMHRTVSLDYGVVLEGEIELLLDSGETRAMKRGDVAIQRGTNHAWRNPSSTNWARMMYVLQESKPVQLGEKALGEDYGEGMDGVPSSGKK